MSEDFLAHPAEFRPGMLIAGYRLEAQVGAGGMAVVFRARDERLDRLVAIKIMDPARASDPAFRRRFIAESRAAAKVEDPHIIPVYEAAESDGVLFIAMRFAHGGDLRKVLAREGALAPERAMEFISPVASALDAAHAAGLVHRDVKPANILVDARPGRPEQVYLSDFGIAKAELSGYTLTEPGSVLGTPDYSAPEQIEGKAVDARADQYALACVAYQLLTGVPPFERDQTMAVMVAHLYAPPPSLLARRPDLPRAADPVLARAMAKDPDERYASCGHFAGALREALGVAADRPGGSAGPASPQDYPQTLTLPAKPQLTAPEAAGEADDADLARHGPGRPAPAQRSAPARRPRRASPAFRARAGAVAIGVAGVAAVAVIVTALVHGPSGVVDSATFAGYSGQHGTVTIDSVASGGGIQLAVGSADGHPAIWRRGAVGAWELVPAMPADAGALRGATLTSVAHGPHGWIAVGDAGCGALSLPVAVTSADGLRWRILHGVLPFAGRGFCATAVAAGPDGYVVVGTQSNGMRRFAALWSSADLKSWDRDSNGGLDGSKRRSMAFAVAALPAGFVAAGEHGADGAIWTSAAQQPEQDIAAPAALQSLVLRQVTVAGSRIVAAGYGVTSRGDVPIAVVSTDGGMSWRPVVVLRGGDGAVTALTATATGFVAAGSVGPAGAQRPVTWSSRDGVHWSRPSGGPEITALFASDETVDGVAQQGKGAYFIPLSD